MKKIIKFSFLLPVIITPFCLLSSCSKKTGELAFCISNQNLYSDVQNSGYIKIYNPVKGHVYGYNVTGLDGAPDPDSYLDINKGTKNDLVDFSVKQGQPLYDTTVTFNVTDNGIDALDDNSYPIEFDVMVHANSDEYREAESDIKNLSFTLRAGRKLLGGGCFNNSALFGTAWICDKIDATTYNLMTNWHVEIDASSLDYTTLQFAYCLDNGNMVGWHSFDSWKEIGNGKIDGTSDGGADMFEYKVSFKNDDSVITDKLNNIDSNFTDLISETARTDWVDSIDTTFYIGGFPGKSGSQSTSAFKWTFEAVHACMARGYNGKDWTNPIEGETIGHYVGDNKHFSVANEVIMNGLQCNALEHGASGSLCLVESQGQLKVFGIYWGGWKEDNSGEFFGSVEPFDCRNNKIFGEDNSTWSNYLPEQLFN